MELGLRNEVSVLRSENVPPVERVEFRVLVISRVVDDVPRDTSEGVLRVATGVRVDVERVDAELRGVVAVRVLEEPASRDELGCARVMVGTPLEVVRDGVGR